MTTWYVEKAHSSIVTRTTVARALGGHVLVHMAFQPLIDSEVFKLNRIDTYLNGTDHSQRIVVKINALQKHTQSSINIS